MNRTEKAIIDAFWQLLEEKPYNKITVQNIVERCQVNRNTFYYHFQDIPTLAERSIQDWTESVIEKNFRLGSPENCIIPITQEMISRKTAIIHLFHSGNRESFMRYLNEISQNFVQFYIDNVTKDVDISAEDKETLAWYYKCTFVGIIIDWLDSKASYDLTAFCERVLHFFEDSGRRQFLMYTNTKKAIPW